MSTPRSGVGEPLWVRAILITLALLFLAVFLLLPLLVVFGEALAKGLDAYLAALSQPDAISAILLTLLVAVIAVPLNTLFGLMAAWCLGKFRFRGRSLLLAVIDLPFSVSPIVADQSVKLPSTSFRKAPPPRGRRLSLSGFFTG